MASRKPVKPYAVELVKAFRQDAKTARNRVPTAVDLADVLAVKPQIVISPQNAIVEYDEEYLVFQIDPDSLKVGDVVVIGRAPSGQPIVLGLADWSNPDPFLDPDLQKLQKDFNSLKKNASHIKPPVKSLDLLPNDGNDHGDTIIVEDDNSIQAWNGETGAWEPLISMSSSGGPLTPTGPTLTVNTNYSASASDSIILVDATSGPVTVTLPAGHTNGQRYYIKDKLGAATTNAITIDTSNADTIDGQNLITLTVNRQSIAVVSDGSNWYLI